MQLFQSVSLWLILVKELPQTLVLWLHGEFEQVAARVAGGAGREGKDHAHHQKQNPQTFSGKWLCLHMFDGSPPG